MTADDARLMTASDSRITADDVTRLNRATVARSAAFTRLAGIALIVVGAVGVLAWLWYTIREQQVIDDNGGVFGSDSGGISLLDRIDAFVGTLGLLLTAALLAGSGLALRLVADYSIARTGGSLTGFDVGDEMPADDVVEVELVRDEVADEV